MHITVLTASWSIFLKLFIDQNLTLSRASCNCSDSVVISSSLRFKDAESRSDDAFHSSTSSWCFRVCSLKSSLALCNIYVKEKIVSLLILLLVGTCFHRPPGILSNHSCYLDMSELITTQKRISTWCHHKQSLLILFTIQSYKSYYMCHRKQSLLILFTIQSYNYKIRSVVSPCNSLFKFLAFGRHLVLFCPNLLHILFHCLVLFL